jgi:hypothetical protein
LRLLPLHGGLSGKQNNTGYRWQSAAYAEQFGHHAIDSRAAVAVRCQIVYCPIEAVKLAQKKVK